MGRSRYKITKIQLKEVMLISMWAGATQVQGTMQVKMGYWMFVVNGDFVTSMHSHAGAWEQGKIFVYSRH